MRRWTSVEEEALRVLAGLGCRATAAALERSPKSVECRARRLGVSLRRRSLEGVTRVALSESARGRIATILDADLCPACGMAPIAVRSTGLCPRCHYKALRLVHEEETARLDGLRELCAARQKLQRRRRKLIETDTAHAAPGELAGKG